MRAFKKNIWPYAILLSLALHAGLLLSAKNLSQPQPTQRQHTTALAFTVLPTSTITSFSPNLSPIPAATLQAAAPLTRSRPAAQNVPEEQIPAKVQHPQKSTFAATSTDATPPTSSDTLHPQANTLAQTSDPSGSDNAQDNTDRTSSLGSSQGGSLQGTGVGGGSEIGSGSEIRGGEMRGPGGNAVPESCWHAVSQELTKRAKQQAALPALRRRRQDGVVVLAITLSQENAAKVSIVQSSGHVLLDEAALTAARAPFDIACQGTGHWRVRFEVTPK